MALRLKNRQRPVPGGAPYYDPATRYMTPRFASFDATVDGVIQARLANPGVTKQHGLATDRTSVESEVDLAWATFCWQKKYLNFIEGEPEARRPVASPPFQQVPQTRPSPSQSGRRVAAGVEAIVDWIANGAEAVPSELANKRAATCVACPLNERVASLTDVFTNAVASGIRSALNWRKEWKLETPDDEKLFVCSGCSCPLRLMIHIPIDRKLKSMSKETHDSLAPQCWVLSEEKALTA